MEPLSATEPLPVHRPGVLPRACLLLALAIAQWALMLLQPIPALAADPCPPSMVLIPGGSYRIGAGAQLPEEQPVRNLRLSPFCLDRTEVSNDHFAAFVAATGYVTVAERPLAADQFPELAASERAPGSVVFEPVGDSGPIEELSWWHWVPGADWRHPEGPGSDLAGRGQHPVVQVAYEDAEAFARWAGGFLPSEAQWEFAARGASRIRSSPGATPGTPIGPTPGRARFHAATQPRMAMAEPRPLARSQPTVTACST